MRTSHERQRGVEGWAPKRDREEYYATYARNKSTRVTIMQKYLLTVDIFFFFLFHHRASSYVWRSFFHVFSLPLVPTIARAVYYTWQWLFLCSIRRLFHWRCRDREVCIVLVHPWRLLVLPGLPAIRTRGEKLNLVSVYDYSWKGPRCVVCLEGFRCGRWGLIKFDTPALGFREWFGCIR